MRKPILDRLRSDQFDGLIIGGGATGGGIALDAAPRGQKTTARIVRCDVAEDADRHSNN